MEDFTDGASAVMNISLMGWVIENICKNAIDAMDGRGSIEIAISALKNKIWVAGFIFTRCNQSSFITYVSNIRS